MNSMKPYPNLYKGQRLTNYSGIDVTVERTVADGFSIVAVGPNHAQNDVWCSLKVLRPDLPDEYRKWVQERIEELFQQTALTWRSVWPHPNLLTTQGIVEIEGQPMLVLDYPEFGSLQHVFAVVHRQGSWFPVGIALSYAQQIAAGLLHLHSPSPDLLRDTPTVHGDLKPLHIMLSGSFAEITNFGLSAAVDQILPPAVDWPGLDRETALVQPTTVEAFAARPVVSGQLQVFQTPLGLALGSPGYMAPELWNDAGKLDTTTDVYAFGVVVAELFTGRHPLAGVRPVHTLAEWRLGHLERQPIFLRNLGAEHFMAEQDALLTADERARMDNALEVVERLVEKLLAKDREARPDMATALSDLRAAATALGENPYAPPELYPRTTANEVTYWLGRADACAHFKLQTEALARVERALILAPQDPQVLSTYGHILEGLGQLEEAVTAYQSALGPADDPTGRSRIINLLGTALSHLGRYGEAETVYVAQLDSMPEDSSGWFNRGLNEAQWAEAEANAGRLGEAREHMEQGLACVERALALEPARSPYRFVSEELRHLRDALEAQ